MCWWCNGIIPTLLHLMVQHHHWMHFVYSIKHILLLSCIHMRDYIKVHGVDVPSVALKWVTYGKTVKNTACPYIIIREPVRIHQRHDCYFYRQVQYMMLYELIMINLFLRPSGLELKLHKNKHCMLHYGSNIHSWRFAMPKIGNPSASPFCLASLRLDCNVSVKSLSNYIVLQGSSCELTWRLLLHLWIRLIYEALSTNSDQPFPKVMRHCTIS